MEKDYVQSIRDLIRPFLTVTFSSAFLIGILMCLSTSLKIMILEKEFNLEPVAALLGLVGTPLGGILVYHFTKSAKKDSVKTS